MEASGLSNRLEVRLYLSQGGVIAGKCSFPDRGEVTLEMLGEVLGAFASQTGKPLDEVLKDVWSAYHLRNGECQ